MPPPRASTSSWQRCCRRTARCSRVFDDAGFEAARTLQDGVIEVVLRLGSAPASVGDQRDHVAVAASLKPFFKPASVAVIGASPRRARSAASCSEHPGRPISPASVYPVNRGGDPVGGVAGYATVADLPVRVDLAVDLRPGRCGDRRGAVRCSRPASRRSASSRPGFAEIGAEGSARQDEFLALVRAHGARLVGPNCLGIASSLDRLNATFARRALPAGRIAFSSQSGALGLASLEEADSRGLGLSSFVSIGNKADVSSNDLLEYWEEDDESDLILLDLESFGNP